MQLHHRFVVVAAACIAFAGTSQARQPPTPKTPLDDCVTLGPNHQAFGFGKQYLLIQDGDSHYRLAFRGDCEALSLSTQVVISTAGETNRLCPQATKVNSRSRSCSVSSVDRIDADRYARYRKTSR
jgi:hypothetical protein